LVIVKGPAKFPGGVELVDGIGAEEETQRAVAAKADYYVLCVCPIYGCELNSFDKRGGFAEKVFAIGFVAGHGRSISMRVAGFQAHSGVLGVGRG
jgi:hypothetical protein